MKKKGDNKSHKKGNKIIVTILVTNENTPTLSFN